MERENHSRRGRNVVMDGSTCLKRQPAFGFISSSSHIALLYITQEVKAETAWEEGGAWMKIGGVRGVIGVKDTHTHTHTHKGEKERDRNRD